MMRTHAKLVHFFLAVALTLPLFSCKSAQVAVPSVNGLQGSEVLDKYPWLVSSPSGKKPKVALVLSGGAARGFAHIGVIRVLEQEKIPVDFIVGTSVGSLIAALYGSAKNSFELEWLAFDLKKEDLFDFTIFTPTQGYVKIEQLIAFMQKKITVKNLEDLRFPLFVTASDLYTGEQVIFSKGSIETAVRASVSIPVLFPPLLHEGRLLVDGGVLDNIPADIARKEGADIVIAVDLSKDLTNKNLFNIKDYAMQSIAIMMALNSQEKAKFADVLIRPDTSGVDLLDFTKKKDLMAAGIKSTEDAIPQIREAFKKWHSANK